MPEFSPFEQQEMYRILKTALKEDIGSGDITTKATISQRAITHATITAKSPCVFAGIQVAASCFSLLNNNISLSMYYEDGDRIGKGDIVLEIVGPTRAILQAERTALNLLGRMSGIATVTAQFVEKTSGTNAKILDTRKTIPGLRFLDKYAVRAGGGCNHRVGLYDMFLIKENHIIAAGGISEAVERCKAFLKLHKTLESTIIIVEVLTPDDAETACAAGVGRILLDNMKPAAIRAIVTRFQGKVKLEVSGGITLKNVHDYAKTGVDYISIGMLTHSPPSADFSLLLE